MKEGFVPLYIIDRLIKKTNALQYNDRIGKLREMAESRGFQLD